ncbi:hypothetical protein THAOC_00119 [Thalassiosira oceanica]|uniref:RNA-editing substrate-binding complex 6 protein domain-containing protein n=1 Tax=Thalassiosira oceanica TaxID=159749 RepID=K0TPJ9_THAOC|nr:hypothetical protein THAOC_00119 [Thalassiosira oceanica]|eukprot:EJK78006.1 hypothetical protein THAOC_00119 [Thalassiosira oceanica]
MSGIRPRCVGPGAEVYVCQGWSNLRAHHRVRARGSPMWNHLVPWQRSQSTAAANVVASSRLGIGDSFRACEFALFRVAARPKFYEDMIGHPKLTSKRKKKKKKKKKTSPRRFGSTQYPYRSRIRPNRVCIKASLQDCKAGAVYQVEESHELQTPGPRPAAAAPLPAPRAGHQPPTAEGEGAFRAEWAAGLGQARPPELGTSRPRRERERFEPYEPGKAKRGCNDEDGSRRHGRYQHQGPGQQRQSRFQPPELGPSRPRQERLAPYEPGSAKRGHDNEDGSRGRDSWERRKRSRRDDDGRKHRHEERGQRYSSRDGPVSKSGDRSQFRSRSRSRGRQSDWSRGCEEGKSPWGGTNDRGHGRMSWSDSTRRAYPEESTVVHRSTMLDRNGCLGRGWDRAQGGDRGQCRGGRGRGAASMQGRGPDFRTCQTLVELVNLARCNLDSMNNRAIAAFWSTLPRLLHKRGAQDPNLEENLRCFIGITCTRIHSFQCRDLAQASLGIAKTISQISRGDQEYRADDPRQIMWGLFVNESQSSPIFDSIASSAVGMLNGFDARCLSNLIYSFGLVERNPDIGGETLFNVFGEAAGKILHTFKSQDLSNMLWAFVKVDAKNSRLFQDTGGVISGMDLDSFQPQHLANILWSFAKSGKANPELFQALGNHIVARRLNDFQPQALSNIAWAFATSGVSHPELFKKIGDHIASPASLGSFKPQDLSNTALAFAKAGVSHPKLFQKIGDHVARLMSLDSFKPQALSNTPWAFATAGASHPELFKKIGDHIAVLDSLGSFKPQDFSNTAWAFATARVFHPRLFEKLTTEAVASKDHFDDQEVSNFLWACATVGHTDQRLFSAFAPVIASRLGKFNKQHLANIAWAYSVANLPRHDLFNKGYVSALASNEKEFSVELLAQLHQWQLWQQELESGIEVPQSLRAKCRNAFTSAGYSESRLQNDVVDELKAAGLDLEEEVLLGSGYRIDALVKVGDERKVAVEVDGPSHFIDRRPVGKPDLLAHNHPAGGSLGDDSGSRPSSASAFFEVKTFQGNPSKRTKQTEAGHLPGHNTGAIFDCLTRNLRPTHQFLDSKASWDPSRSHKMVSGGRGLSPWLSVPTCAQCRNEKQHMQQTQTTVNRDPISHQHAELAGTSAMPKRDMVDSSNSRTAMIRTCLR